MCVPAAPVCTHTCVHLGARVPVCTCAYVYAHLRTPVCMCTCMHTCTCKYLCVHAPLCMCTCVCMHLRACVYMLLCVHASVCTRLQAPVHACTGVCTCVPHLPSSDGHNKLSRTAPSAPTLRNDNLGYSSRKAGFLPKGPSGLRGSDHCILCI